MKENKKNMPEKKSHRNVETPPPPQVMDPSAPPVKKEDDKNKSKKKPRAEKKYGTDAEKLAPNEEL
jgi:hypothetical protein